MTLSLQDRRVLIIEDESLVAMLLETVLEDLGCTPVGPASSVDEGLRLIETETGLDAALLDVNVAGREVFPVAEALKAKDIPFVFSTGYGEGGLPDVWRGQATIQKPFTEDAVKSALFKALGVVRV